MSSVENDLAYWIALSRLPKLGPKSFALLRQHFPTMKEVWQANETKLRQAGLDKNLIETLIAHRAQTDVIKSQQQVADLKIDVTAITDSDYPKLLKEIYDPPPLIFTRGDKKILSNFCLAVVGSRQASTYGLAMTRQIVGPLAQAGTIIVSGLAYGIDATAHQTTLEAGGKTIAVMASGLDQIYPAANRRLANHILEKGGLWLSEFPPGTAPLKQNFPFRNRIIAGLSSGTVVIEATRDSGALLTAKHALEANREIFALPGNIISPTSEGTNDLLKQGAHLITESQDILSVFGLKSESVTPRQPLTTQLESLLERLPYEPTHLESLVRELKLSPAELTSSLTLLEIKGYIKDEGGQLYRRLK